MPRPFSSARSPQAGRAAGPDVLDHRREVPACRSALRAMAALSGAPPLPARLSAAAPWGCPAAPRGSLPPPGLLGPPGDRLALGLGDQRHDADRQIVRFRQVDPGEPHPAIAQRQQEGGIPRQPVELGDHQRRPGDLGEVQRLTGPRLIRITPHGAAERAPPRVRRSSGPALRSPGRRPPPQASALPFRIQAKASSLLEELLDTAAFPLAPDHWLYFDCTQPLNRSSLNAILISRSQAEFEHYAAKTCDPICS